MLWEQLERFEGHGVALLEFSPLEHEIGRVITGLEKEARDLGSLHEIALCLHCTTEACCGSAQGPVGRNGFQQEVQV